MSILTQPLLETPNFPVPWTESNSQSWEFAVDRHSASRYAQFDGKDEYFFTTGICGYSELLPDGTITRKIPEFHPKFPWLWARTVRYNRETDQPTCDGPFFSLQYKAVEAVVDYEPLPYQVWDDDQWPPGLARNQEQWRYVSLNETFAVESVIGLTGSFIFSGTPDGIRDVPARPVPSYTVAITWHEVPCEGTDDTFGLPAIPLGIKSRIDSTMGKINLNSFMGYPPRCLLALGVEPNYRRMHDGKWCADLKYTFGGRGRVDLSAQDAANAATSTPNWIRLLTKSNTFLPIEHATLHTRPYDEVDFYGLLQSGA